MGKQRRERREQKYREKNGILGQLDLHVREVLLLDTILERLRYPYNRKMIHACLYQDVNGAVRVNTDEEALELADKFRQLALHLKKQAAPTAQKEADYCG